MELEFKRDTAFRKQFFTQESFAHPAKMDCYLLLWIVGNYTKPGEVILDPMAGMGTTMLACTAGRNVVLVELEDKFCKMMIDNWEIVRTKPQLGHQMGNCQIIQGDARQLEGLLVDNIVTSPPFAEAYIGGDGSALKALETSKGTKRGRGFDSFGGKTLSKADNPDNIGNLPYGNIDAVITSPPYAERHSYPDIERERQAVEKLKAHPDSQIGGSRIHEHCSDNPDNIGNLPYGEVDAVITSPPYEGQIHPTHETIENVRATNDPQNLGQYSQPLLVDGYGGSAGNIGNLKSESYLSAMLQVYQQCHQVLKSQGLMILVTKNFIRNKQVVRLDEDTIKLCEEAGFSFLERHYRRLPAQSFWRIIALLKCDHRKGSKQNPKCELGLQCPIKVKEHASYLLGLEPEEMTEQIEVIEKLCPSFVNSSPKIEFEDILVFQR